MNLTIDLSDQSAAVLESRARAAHMPPDRYLTGIVERALEREHLTDAENLGRHLDEMASRIDPETTPEQLEAALADALAAVRPQRRWHP